MRSIRTIGRRQLLGGLGAVGAGLLVAACGGSTAAPTAPPARSTEVPKAAAAQSTKPAAAAATKPAAAATAAPAAAPASSGQKVHLVFIGHVAGGEGEQKAYDAALDTWNKAHPEATVEYQVIPDAERITRMTAMVAADTAPDMWRHNFGVVRLWASQGHLLDLTDLMPKGYDKNFLPGLMAAMFYKGRYWALAHTTDTSALFFRNDALDAIGATAPAQLKDAWSWQQFGDLCDKLIKGGKHQFAFGHNQRGRWVPQFFYSTGAKVVSDDFKKMTVNTPDGLRGLQFIKDWHSKKWVPPAHWSTTQDNVILDDFIRGTTAMTHVGQWNITYMDENIGQKFKWSVTFTPHDKIQVTSLGGTPIVGWKKTKYPQQVAQFFGFFTSTEQVKQFDEMANYMPVRNDLLDQKINYRVRPDLMGIFQQQIKTLPADYVAFTARTYSSGIGTLILEETTKMNLSGQSVQDTAKNIDTRGNKFIQDNPDVEA